MFQVSSCDTSSLHQSWADISKQGRLDCAVDAIAVPIIYSAAVLALLYRCGIQFQSIVRRIKVHAKMYKSVNVIYAVTAVCSAVVPLMALSGDIATANQVPYIAIVDTVLISCAWTIFLVIIYSEQQRGYVDKDCHGIVRAFPIVSFGIQLFKIIVLDGVDRNSYFYAIFALVFALQTVAAFLSLTYFPTNGRVVIPPGAEDTDSDVELQENTSKPSSSVVCPEKEAGIISSLIFGWMDVMIKFGYRTPLQEEHIWKLNNIDKAETLFPKFEKHWKEQVSRLGVEKASVYESLKYVFWRPFTIGGALKISNDAATFIGPVFLNLLTKYISSPTAKAYEGYLFAIGLFVGQAIGALAEAQYLQYVMRVGMNVRTVLITAIFQKSMIIDNETRQKISTGKINNLMSADTEAIQNLLQNFHQIWSAPFRIIVALILLYVELGWPALLGCSLLLTLLPLQKKVMEISAKLVRASLMKSDERVKVVNETLEAMSVVKTYAWEKSFFKKVKAVREEELKLQLKASFLSALNYFIIFTIPVLVSLISFTVFAGIGNELTPARAFTALALFDILRFPMYTLPSVINQLISARVSLNRIRDLLTGGEINLISELEMNSKAPAISIKNGHFGWDSKSDALDANLKSINFEVKPGELFVVIGTTGSGKSSVISALLGEMFALKDELGEVSKVQVRGKVAYVPQQAWIFNETLRNNILFGKPFDESIYTSVLRNSCLERDCEILGAGDLTEIGERGVNLSGGQKQRVAIARAVYSNADLYLFDDPLSALDAHVARELFENCILGFLKGKTRLLVTNQIQFISQADRIMIMKDGRIDAIGTYDELLKTCDSFRDLISKQVSEGMESKSEHAEQGEHSDTAKKTAKTDNPKREDKSSTKSNAMLIVKEEREVGHVSFRVVWGYISALGSFPLVLSIIFLLILSQLCATGNSVWLSLWSETFFGDSYGTGFYIGIYCAWALGNCFTILIYQLMLANGAINAGRKLHENMFGNLLRAPLRFFNENPVGRLLNRFTKDQSDIDRGFAMMLSMYVSSILSMIGGFAVIGYSTPYVLLIFLPVMLLLYYVGEYFQRTARELKRLDAISRSPVYAHFSQCLNGLTTIRAFNVHSSMMQENASKVDNAIRMTHMMFSANRWLGVRLELLGSFMIFITAIFIVASKGSIRAAIAALSLSYALQITGYITRNIRFGSVVEQSFNSVERVQYYGSIPNEAPAVIPGKRPPANWPSQGALKFSNVQLRYREDLPLVLRGLSFEVLPCQKVGIVGRTGAGKSSIFVSLFRLVELAGGYIELDGLNLGELGLEDVRSNISIIPQDPVLFTGSVRFNLDPFDEHSDEEVWAALHRSSLKVFIESLEGGLSAKVEERGGNFSVGQRQLVCMARALLRASKVLVLDEATASVDVETDRCIQRTIREEFKGCTMLIIAHRLNTVIDCDRILVMDSGRAVEFGSAAELLKEQDGVFSSMVASTGELSAQFLRSQAVG
jgi:ATP-binding cassette subfamily C (CFTR/MRP) protein 1